MTEDEFNEYLREHNRKVLQPTPWPPPPTRPKVKVKYKPAPFYGVDGNLLVEDLQEDHAFVQQVGHSISFYF
jgi:hypothetical protein